MVSSFHQTHLNTDITVLENFKQALLENGKIVIDFLNIAKIKQHLIEKETFDKNGLTFHITRKIKEEILIKEISFEADGRSHHYTEKVQCLTLEKMIKLAGMATPDLLTADMVNAKP